MSPLRSNSSPIRNKRQLAEVGDVDSLDSLLEARANALEFKAPHVEEEDSQGPEDGLPRFSEEEQREETLSKILAARETRKPEANSTARARSAWYACATRFGVPVTMYTATRRREIFGSTLHGSIIRMLNYKSAPWLSVSHYSKLLFALAASARQVLSNFVSTEHDVFRIVTEDSTYVPPFACVFGNTIGNSKLLAVADEEGMIGIINAAHDVRYETEKPRSQWLAHHNAIFDICWSADDRHLVSAAGDQTVRIWDVETRKCTTVFKGHNCSIKSVTNHPNNSYVFATAARDGRIMTWDTRCSTLPGSPENPELYYRPASTINNAHALTFGGQTKGSAKARRSTSGQTAASPSQSVTSVRYIPNHDSLLASSGAADGLIKMWDMRNTTTYLRQAAPQPFASSAPLPGARRAHGFSSFTLNSDGSRLYASCTDNHIYEFEAGRLGEPVQRFSAADYRCDTFYIKTSLSPDERFIASGSSDNGLYIWELGHPEKPPLVLRGHTGEVTGVSWNRTDLGMLASCSDDASVRIWNVDMDFDEEKQDRAYRDLRGRAEEGTLRLPEPETKKRSPSSSPLRVPPPAAAAAAAPAVRTRTSRSDDAENQPPTPTPVQGTDSEILPTRRRGSPAVGRGSSGRGNRVATARSIRQYFPSPG
ncbi:hypothetical protein HDU87_005440 [Geranomyces variabilis]|uniref:WD40 repeat-like protein n=1 Tax=Geranomyces variabilis TaxID=109894 RepID=A0AAD5XR86_9FUNG|nr:hypothetical protein HDU87_005440 [Geranomyces variabilis]